MLLIVLNGFKARWSGLLTDHTNDWRNIMSKKTSALRAFEMIKTLPVGSSFSVNDIMAKMPDYVTKSAIGNIVGRMVKRGYLTKIKGSLQYGVIEKTKTYDKKHKFNTGGYTFTSSKDKPSAVSTNGDYDIIENLLNAMAAAEPILRRYKQLDKFVKTFNDLSNIK